MKQLLGFIFSLLLTGQVWAADNAVIVTPGTGLTLRSRDVGTGIQSLQQILGDTSGNALATAPGTPNASFALPIQGVTGGTAIPISGSITIASGSTTVVQPTGTNLHAVLDTTSTTAVTQPTAANLNATVQPGNTANTTPWLFSPSTGGNTAAVKAASTAPVATDSALVVSISPNSVNANGQATMANSAPVAIASNQSTVPVGLQAIATGGWTPKWFIAAGSDNATNLKASAGTVHAVQVFGIASTPVYLKFYNTTTTPTCGSSTIVKQIMIPAASTAANGAGAVAVVLDTAFSTGISYCVVTGITATDDTSPTANQIVVNIDWL